MHIGKFLLNDCSHVASVIFDDQWNLNLKTNAILNYVGAYIKAKLN